MIAPVPTAPPREIDDLAAACVRFVKDALDFELDYTADTLPVLDHYLRTRARKASDEVVDLLAPAAGAYFGEVVRRSMGAIRWHCPAGDYRGYRLEFERMFLHFNPLGVAREVLTRQDADGWQGHFAVLDEVKQRVADSLAATDDVREEDYYTFCVRLEALQQVASVLGALESQAPHPRHFGPEVYRAATGESLPDGKA